MWKGLSHVTSWFGAPVVGGTAWLKKETDTWIIIINTSGIRKKLKFVPLRYSSRESRKSAGFCWSLERIGCGRDVIRRCFREETGIETYCFHCFALLPITLAKTDPRGHQSRQSQTNIFVVEWQFYKNMERTLVQICPVLRRIPQKISDKLDHRRSGQSQVRPGQGETTTSSPNFPLNNAYQSDENNSLI